MGYRIVDCVRETDTVARFDGDEFVVMFGELDVDKAEFATQAGLVTEKICATLRGIRPNSTRTACRNV